MKYIIWGAGQRGQKALEIFGKENIICFVDKDVNRVGNLIQGIEIKGIDYITKEMNQSTIVLISIVEGYKDVAAWLKERDVYTYLIFEEHPFGIDLSLNSNNIEATFDFVLEEDRIGILGIEWFSLYLYDYLVKKNKKVVLGLNGRESVQLIKLVEQEYCIDDVNKTCDVLLVRKNSLSETKIRTICLEDYLEKSMRFYNPLIEGCKNIHHDKRCFIVATGPSLKVEDLDKLYQRGEICLSMNRIYNIFDRTEWRPDYYFIEDEKMIEDIREDLWGLDLKYKFVNNKPEIYWENEKSKSSIKYNMIMQTLNDEIIGFSNNPEHCVYNGRTVTYICLQFAIYMGFKEIYLLGLDFNYSKDIYDVSNHFEGYQNHYKDIRLNPISPDKMLRAYQEAKKVAEEKGISIYNATRGGKLEVFERRNIDLLLKEE